MRQEESALANIKTFINQTNPWISPAPLFVYSPALSPTTKRTRRIAFSYPRMRFVTPLDSHCTTKRTRGFLSPALLFTHPLLCASPPLSLFWRLGVLAVPIKNRKLTIRNALNRVSDGTRTR